MCRLPLEMRVPVDSSASRGSAAACVPLDPAWWQNAGKRIPNVHRAHREPFLHPKGSALASPAPSAR
ncbi:hypothetical protein fugu_010006 [Takifugu bimaculatus]|uniref:Uncharacterized protein n=1 Tax=Takifugu bimaculatus TaxID=433685 RepID=A0A4Z2CEA3_9TELE|nr:hypothetical protein fugu_010006 [Takifugu bimaculatus]